MSTDAKLRGSYSYEKFMKDTSLALLRSDQRSVFIVTFGQDGKVNWETAEKDERGAAFNARLEKMVIGALKTEAGES